MKKQVKDWLMKNFSQERLSFEEPMSLHTTLKAGGRADAAVWPDSVKEIKRLLQYAGEHRIPWFVMGKGSNILVRDEGFRGIAIILTRFKEIHIKETETGRYMITADAGVSLRRLCRIALANSLAGLTFATGIPGSVGGAVTMNAGAWGQDMSDILDSFEIVTSRTGAKSISSNKSFFGYRELRWELILPGDSGPHLITRASFLLEKGDAGAIRKEASEYAKKRKKSQPVGSPSAGSFFKNPSKEISAGMLIERAGLKGFSVGGAQVSQKHANFIVNRGSATAEDIIELARIITGCVEKKFNITLVPEVKII